MAGVVHTAFSMRSWDFSGLQSSTSEEYCIMRRIPVDGYREGTAIVRIHSRTISAALGKIEVRVVECSPTDEDPGLDFDGTQLAIAQVPTGTTAGLVTAAFSTPFGGLVSIFVKGTQGSSVVTLRAVLSADLVLKE
jgi:hypothetical protein